MSKVSIEEYYHALERMSDNTGTRPPSVSDLDLLEQIIYTDQLLVQSPIRELRQCVREFRYIRLMK